MASEANKFRLGLFVTIGLAAALGSVIFMGATRFFQMKLRFRTFFDESVQGLEVGSPLKYRGVQMGTVSRICVPPDSDWVAVEVEVAVEAIYPDGFGEHEERTLQADLQELIEKGLRVRLTSAGITGLRFLELDYLDPEKYPVREPDVPPAGLWVPAAPSVLRSVETSIVSTLDKIEGVDFVGIAEKAGALLHALERLTASLDAKSISEEARKTLETANRLLSSPHLVASLKQLDSVAANLERISARLDELLKKKEVDALVADLSSTVKSLSEASARAKTLIDNADRALKEANVPGAAASFRDAAGAFTSAAANIVPIRAELSKTLEDLGSTLRSVQRLVDYIERDPAALLRGKGEAPRR